MDILHNCVLKFLRSESYRTSEHCLPSALGIIFFVAELALSKNRVCAYTIYLCCHLLIRDQLSNMTIT